MTKSTFLFTLLRALTAVRTNGAIVSSFSYLALWVPSDVRRHVRLGVELDFIDPIQAGMLQLLISNSLDHAGKPFPDDMNSGPVMPVSVWYERAKAEGKLQAVPANEPVQLHPAAARPELRLLCLLVENATDTYTVPLGTMHPVPPRASIKGRWPSVGSPGVVMREAHAIAPPPEVLARLQRHGQTRSVCAAESPRRHCATV